MCEFNPFDKVMWRQNTEWRADIVSHITEENKVFLLSGYAIDKEKILPYAGNEYLLGTKDSPTPPEEFKWGDKVEVKSNCNGEWQRGIYLGQREKSTYPFLVLTEGSINIEYQRYCRHADW